jgi:Protein of unknown function (DUF551)
MNKIDAIISEEFNKWWEEFGALSKARFTDQIAVEAWDYQQAKLDAQAKELGALRGFANANTFIHGGKMKPFEEFWKLYKSEKNWIDIKFSFEDYDLENEVEEISEDAWNAATEAAKPRWIPVTERLPDNDSEVFILFTDSIGESRPFIDEFKTDKKWFRMRHVTHWMAIPEHMPKEEIGYE